jgi:pimeloyl-ACP methyl ester carboxylesterase
MPQQASRRHGTFSGAGCLSVAALLACCMAAHAGEPVRFHSVKSPDGVVLNVADAGPEHAPALLFVHGIGQSWLSWRKQLEGPLADRFRMVALDLRGHGDSSKPDDPGSYREACRWADDIQAVMQSLGISKPILVAWSFGGLVTMHYVRCRGVGELRGIVLVATSGGQLVSPQGAGPREGARLAGAAAREMSAPDLRRNLAGAKQFAALMTASAPDDAWQAETVAALLRLPAYVRRALAGEVTGPGGTRLTSNADLVPRLDLPLLVVTGGKDPLSDGRVLADAYVSSFPAARVVVYADSGHSPFAEEPARFNAELEAFVRSASVRRRAAD